MIKMFYEALIFAAEKHKLQLRKDGTPYIYHPMRVALLLKEKGYDEKYQITGLLHDVLEDTDATTEEVSAFGEDVLTAVKLLSKNYSKSDYYENILKNPIAKAVKNCDRIDNLSDSVNSKDMEFRRRYLIESRKEFYGKFSVELDELIEAIEKQQY